jgi:hypothetical protein
MDGEVECVDGFNLCDNVNDAAIWVSQVNYVSTPRFPERLNHCIGGFG